MIHHLLEALKNCVGAALPSPVLNLFFGLAIPNHTHPAMSIPCSIPENIQKFKTITTLLAHLTCTIPSVPTNNLEDPKWAESHIRQELKILDAFAQLAVSQHDVVAVSTFKGLGLEMVTCADQETTQTAQTEVQSKKVCCTQRSKWLDKTGDFFLQGTIIQQIQPCPLENIPPLRLCKAQRTESNRQHWST